MTLQTWIEWCEKQLGDMSFRLFRQGYHPAKIEELNQTNPEFREAFGDALDKMNHIMDQMAANPDGFYHFEDFKKAKAELLDFTEANKHIYLNGEVNELV